jgi:hypothetical protein
MESMKFRNYKNKIFAACLSALAVAGCTKDFEEINTSPVLITKEVIKPSMIFTFVLKNTIFASHNTGSLNEYSNYYANQGSGTIFQTRDWSGSFNYAGDLINIAEVIRLTGNDPALKNQQAVARIWKVWQFHQLTDIFGDVPYSQALLDVTEVINQPVYDSQESIYTDMLKELKEAAAQLTAEPSLASFGAADILFNGNAERWVRFANSLRLRLAIRVRYANEALAAQHISDLAGKPMIETNAQAAKLRTIDGAEVTNRNPLYNSFVNSSGYPLWVGLTVTQNLLERDDPRLEKYADPANDGVSGYKGRPMCLFNEEKLPYSEASTAYLDYFFRTAVYDITVMNAAEVYFLRAEAALAGLSAENAQAMYEKGIELSMQQYSVDAGDITDYLDGEYGTLVGTEEEKLREIIIQKYLANFWLGAESWAEYRRTGYPEIWTGSDLGSTNGRIPRRGTYPQSEYTLNETNVRAAVSKLEGGDLMTSKIWWDAKPGLPYLHPRQGQFPPEIY